MISLRARYAFLLWMQSFPFYCFAFGLFYNGSRKRDKWDSNSPESFVLYYFLQYPRLGFELKRTSVWWMAILLHNDHAHPVNTVPIENFHVLEPNCFRFLRNSHAITAFHREEICPLLNSLRVNVFYTSVDNSINCIMFFRSALTVKRLQYNYYS